MRDLFEIRMGVRGGPIGVVVKELVCRPIVHPHVDAVRTVDARRVDTIPIEGEVDRRGSSAQVRHVHGDQVGRRAVRSASEGEYSIGQEDARVLRRNVGTHDQLVEPAVPVGVHAGIGVGRVEPSGRTVESPMAVRCRDVCVRVQLLPGPSVVEREIDRIRPVDVRSIDRDPVEQELNRVESGVEVRVLRRGDVQRVRGIMERAEDIERAEAAHGDADVDGEVVVQAVGIRVDARVRVRRHELTERKRIAVELEVTVCRGHVQIVIQGRSVVVVEIEVH